MQLEDVFARIGMWRGKEECEPLIDRAAVLVDDVAERCQTRLERTIGTKNARGNIACLLAADANNCDRAASGRRRDRSDRLYLGETTTRRSGSTPSDSVCTNGLSASARWMIFRSDGSIGSNLIGRFSRIVRSSVCSAIVLS